MLPYEVHKNIQILAFTRTSQMQSYKHSTGAEKVTTIHRNQMLISHVCVKIKILIPVEVHKKSLVAYSLQTWIFGKADGQFLHALWWLLNLIPSEHTLLHFGRRFGLRMIGMLLVLSASCLFLLRLPTPLPQTYDWLFSLTSANYLSLRHPAAMADI